MTTVIFLLCFENYFSRSSLRGLHRAAAELRGVWQQSEREVRVRAPEEQPHAGVQLPHRGEAGGRHLAHRGQRRRVGDQDGWVVDEARQNKILNFQSGFELTSSSERAR